LSASLLSKSSSHFPTRAFTPSNPRPHFGHPNPRATTGGKAKGIEEADMNEIESVGIRESGGGVSNSVDSEVFSGMDKNDGIAYLLGHVVSHENHCTQVDAWHMFSRG